MSQLGQVLAFSGTAQAQNPLNLPDPYSLITQAEVETALGPGAKMTTRHNARTRCGRMRADGTRRRKEIIIVVRRADAFDASKMQLIASVSDVRDVRDWATMLMPAAPSATTFVEARDMCRSSAR